MKTAIYIEDGVVQLVLTPESDFEKNAIGSFENASTVTEIRAGGFYDCQGGWTRMVEGASGIGIGPHTIDTRPRSLIIRSSVVKKPANENHA